MNEDKKKEALQIVGRYRKNLTRQQFLTLKGQILAGNSEAAVRGLQTIINRQKGGARYEDKAR